MNTRYQRQSFLGEDSQEIIERATVGIVGLGGGGSHIDQQAAHIGFKRYALYDPQMAEDTNLNRLVGAAIRDIGREKLKIARRTIRGLQPDATILSIIDRWQSNPEPLMGCDIVFGGVDSFQDRDELETFCRRHLILYVDIGMDIHQVDGEPPRMAGQVILSAPGHACMKCLGFITPEKLAKEAQAYGAAGPRPQVIWPNGVLASSAVGLAVDALTGWTREMRAPVYLSYDGNSGQITEHPRLQYAPKVCLHYPLANAGKPIMTIL
jgi:molybdopterin/thiamine biosynthesis adenylyltransferase